MPCPYFWQHMDSIFLPLILVLPPSTPGLLTDAQSSTAIKGLIEDAQVDPLSSGSKPAAGADFERYGVNGIPHAQPSQDEATSAAISSAAQSQLAAGSS